MCRIGKKSTICCFALALIALGFGSKSVSATHDRAQTSLFVSPAGTGSLCSQSSPCGLQTALANTIGGDIIYLAGGVYQQSIPVTEVILLDKSISIYGGWNGLTGSLIVAPDRFNSTIDGQNVRRCVQVDAGGAGAKLTGLSLISGYADVFGGGVYTSASSLTIENCKFQNNSAGSIGGGINLANDSAVSILSSLFENNQAGNMGGAINASHGSTLFVRNSTFTSNTAPNGAAIDVDRGSVDVQMNVFDQNTGYQTVHVDLALGYFLFVNNMISNSIVPESTQPATGLSFYYDNTSFGSIYYNTFVGHNKALACDYGNPIFLIINNIFAENSTSISCTSTNLSVGYNLFYENTSNPVPGGSPVVGDPKFVDADHSDYHISVDSAAFNVGGNLNVLTDFEGDPRPSLGAYDIGADELCLRIFLPQVFR